VAPKTFSLTPNHTGNTSAIGNAYNVSVVTVVVAVVVVFVVVVLVVVVVVVVPLTFVRAPNYVKIRV